MSHAHGKVKFKDGTIKYYEYNGTADIVMSCLRDSEQEVSENWRNDDWNDCCCGNEEDVRLYSDYGKGFYFDGKACKNCKSVKPLFNKYDDFVNKKYGGINEF